MIRRRKSVFLTLWLSYIVILILPVTVFVALYSNMEKTMVGNASRSNLAMLEQVRQVVDNHLQEIDQLIVQVATNPKLQTLWTIEDSEQYVQYEEAVRALRNIQGGTGFVESFYVHLRKNDVILTPTMKADAATYFSKIVQFVNWPMEDVRQSLLGGYHFKTFWPVTAIQESAVISNVILSAVSLPLGEKENVWGTLVMMIKDQQIFDLLKQIEWVNSGSIFIIDDTGQVILSSSGERVLTDELRALIAEGSGYKSEKIDGEAYLLSYTTGKSDWKYVSLVPKSVVLERINETKIWAISLLALVLVVGTVAAYWMAYRSYSPIRDMVFAFLKGQTGEPNTFRNEYEFLQSSIMRTMAEGNQLKQALEERVPVVRAHFLNQLLKGQADPAALQQQSLQLMGVSFPHPYVCVILLEVDDSSEFIRSGSERDWALTRFILFNVSTELLGDDGYVTETERGRLALLLHMAANNEETKQKRDAMLEQLKRLIEDRFRMKLSVGISSVHEGIGSYMRCYEEALDALDYRIIHGVSSMIPYEHIGGMERGYYHYPMETEARLMNMMKSGEYDEAAALIDSLITHNVEGPGMTPEMSKTLFFDLLSTMLKVMNALKLDDKALGLSDEEGRNPAKGIAHGKSVEEMTHTIQMLCKAICASVREARSDQGGQLNEQMLAYIVDNYADNGLGLTSLADAFGMTPQYISGLFKKQNGINVTDYIVSVRLTRAKELLAETDLTILQIAKQVGYATDIGFIRVFKKVEGIPPGKYRETLPNKGI